MILFKCDYCKKEFKARIARDNLRMFLEVDNLLELDYWIRKEIDPCPYCKLKAEKAYEEALNDQT